MTSDTDTPQLFHPDPDIECALVGGSGALRLDVTIAEGGNGHPVTAEIELAGYADLLVGALLTQLAYDVERTRPLLFVRDLLTRIDVARTTLGPVLERPSDPDSND